MFFHAAVTVSGKAGGAGAAIETAFSNHVILLHKLLHPLEIVIPVPLLHGQIRSESTYAQGICL